MLWIAASLFFLWCAFREVRAAVVPPPGFDQTSPVYKPYLALVLIGKIGIQHPWCDRLSSYLSHPSRATEEELSSLDMFTHESMHVRGQLNEAKTECEAVQRNYRAAKLLGVPDDIASKNALDYYNILYKRRAIIGGLTGSYYSDQCAPGKAWDEHLEDSTWRIN